MLAILYNNPAGSQARVQAVQTCDQVTLRFVNTKVRAEHPSCDLPVNSSRKTGKKKDIPIRQLRLNLCNLVPYLFTPASSTSVSTTSAASTSTSSGASSSSANGSPANAPVQSSAPSTSNEDNTDLPTAQQIAGSAYYTSSVAPPLTISSLYPTGTSLDALAPQLRSMYPDVRPQNLDQVQLDASFQRILLQQAKHLQRIATLAPTYVADVRKPLAHLPLPSLVGLLTSKKGIHYEAGVRKMMILVQSGDILDEDLMQACVKGDPAMQVLDQSLKTRKPLVQKHPILKDPGGYLPICPSTDKDPASTCPGVGRYSSEAVSTKPDRCLQHWNRPSVSLLFHMNNCL